MVINPYAIPVHPPINWLIIKTAILISNIPNKIIQMYSIALIDMFFFNSKNVNKRKNTTLIFTKIKKLQPHL